MDRRTVISIQYLRAVAAILVVIFHASNNVFEIGMSGVDIFFVISGFIMWTTTAGAGTTPRDFIRRRLVRIVPLYWAMTMFTAFVSVSPLRLGMEHEFGHIVRSLLFLPASTTLAGHPFLPAPVLPVGWTLNLEMFFYAIFALGLALPQRQRLWFVVFTVSAPVVFGLFFADRLPLELRFYTRPELLEFAAGVLLGVAYARGKAPKGAATGAALAALAAALVAFEQPAVDFRALHWGAPALLLCAAGLAAEEALRKRPSRILELLGDASYSIYLVHIPMLSIFRKLLGWPAHEATGPFQTLMLATLATAGCVAAYFLFEKPVDRALRKRFLKRRAPIADNRREP